MEIMKKAIYAGSFDPFTIGHKEIICKAMTLFDEVWIVMAVNSNKTRYFNSEAMKLGIVEEMLPYKNVHFRFTEGLVGDVAKNLQAQYLVRGLRNSQDYTYEEDMAIINDELFPQLETIYLRADSSAISSTLARTLYQAGRPLDGYVPYFIRSAILENENKI